MRTKVLIENIIQNLKTININNILKIIQTIYTWGIFIYTGQEIFLPRVRANTPGEMQLHQEIADLFKIWKTRDHWNTPEKARVYPG